VAQRLGARNVDELDARVDTLLEEIDTLRRDLQRRQQQQAHGSAAALADAARDVRGVRVVSASVESASQEDLKRLVDAVRDHLQSGVVVLGSVQDGRVPLVAGVSRDLVDRIKAGDLLKAVAREAGGGGGGPPHFATGNGTQPAQLGAALQHAFVYVDAILKDS